MPPEETTNTETVCEPAPQEQSTPSIPEQTPETAPEPTPTAQIPANEPFTPAEEKSEITPPPTPEPQPQSRENFSAPTSKSVVQRARDLAVKARAAIQFRKRKKLDRVLELFAKKSQITNDDVEKLLHVSDATATRYLSQLEKEGKIVQAGKTGKGVWYARTM